MIRRPCDDLIDAKRFLSHELWLRCSVVSRTGLLVCLPTTHGAENATRKPSPTACAGCYWNSHSAGPHDNKPSSQERPSRRAVFS